MSRASNPRKSPPPAPPAGAVSQNTRAWHHGALIFACAGLALLIASLTIFKMSNNDIWIHLTTGRQILET